MDERLVATFEQRRSGARLIKFAGVLDEHNRLDELIERVGSGVALINLAGIERINSIGTRDWMKWLKSLEAKGTRPVFIACSPAVVEQLSRIKNFVGNGVIKSFQVPYECGACDREQLLLVHVADLGPPRKRRLPPCSCDACGAQMDVVDESGAYYTVLAELPAAPPRSNDSVAPVARGSISTITPDQVMRISKPRLTPRDSRPSLSAFQLPDGVRQSDLDLTKPRMPPPSERPYLVAIILLLLCMVGVLGFLLLT